MKTPTLGSEGLERHSVAPRTSLRRINVGLFTAGIGIFAPAGGVAIILVPSRLDDLDPAHKVGLLAVFAAGAAVVAFLSAVVVGDLSDRTRSHLGMRNPWLLIGAAACALSLVVLSAADNVPVLAAGMLLLNISVSGAAAACAAIVPDRVPDERKGGASTAVGAGVLVGVTCGAVAAAPFADNANAGFIALVFFPVAGALAFQLAAPDHSNKAHPPLEGRTSVLSTFKFPKDAPDFYWAFFARLVAVLGYYTVAGYQLYILTDYVGLTKSEASDILTGAAIANLIGAIIGSGLGGPVSDRIGRRKIVIVIATFVIAGGTLLPLIAAEPWAIIASTAISGVGLGMFLSVDAAMLAQLLPSEDARGRDLGILSLATNGGQLVGPLVGAAVVGSGLGYRPLFVVASVLCLIGAALLRPIKSVK